MIDDDEVYHVSNYESRLDKFMLC